MRYIIKSNSTTIMAEGRKSLNIKTETWERLQRFGVFRESTDELLNRLMDIAAERIKRENKK